MMTRLGLALLGALLFLTPDLAFPRPRSHVVIQDFEADDSLEAVTTKHGKAERVRGRIKLGKHVLAWTTEREVPAASLTIRNVPGDIRAFRRLQFHVKADREMTDPLLVEIVSGDELECLRYEVRMFRRKGTFVSISIPDPIRATESFDPEKVTAVRLVIEKPRKTWTLTFDDFVFVKERGGWNLTTKDKLHRYFHETGAGLAQAKETPHFLILTNDRRALLGKFPKELENLYDFIRTTLGAPEWEDRLDVYIFDDLLDYRAFTAMRCGASVAVVVRVGGHATTNYFAAPFLSPKDDVFAHELAHVVFRRAFGAGGGSWFHEGVAEYIKHLSKRKSAAKLFAPEIKAGRYVPLIQFVRIRTLALSRTRSPSLLYAQAGAFHEFIRRGPLADRAHDICARLAQVPRTLSAKKHREAIEEILGEPLRQLQEKWLTWGMNPPKLKLPRRR